MIGSLQGKLAHLGAETLILEVGGVGYLVSVPGRLLGEVGPLGSDLKLYTHTYVREDQLSLFGFRSTEDLDFFQLLMSVKGIGPKAALAIISQVETRVVKKAVFQQDQALLATVPGIGPKTAARLILELRDKLKVEYAGGVPEAATSRTVAEGLLRALTSLGYREGEVRKVMAGMKLDGDVTLETAVALALRALDQR